MALFGVVWLLAKYEIIHIPFLSGGEEEYRVKEPVGEVSEQ
jgi:hypothetical protein